MRYLRRIHLTQGDFWVAIIFVGGFHLGVAIHWLMDVVEELVRFLQHNFHIQQLHKVKSHRRHVDDLIGEDAQPQDHGIIPIILLDIVSCDLGRNVAPGEILGAVNARSGLACIPPCWHQTYQVGHLEKKEKIGGSPKASLSMDRVLVGGVFIDGIRVLDVAELEVIIDAQAVGVDQ